MKTPLSITFLALCFTPLLQAQSNDEVKYGIETVSGFRSGYNYRGFELSESTLDFQIESEIAINDYVFLNVGAWYATATGDSDFDESAFFAQLRLPQTDSLTVGLSATYRSVDQGEIFSASISDGVELGAFATWYFNNNLSSTAGAYYDTGADGVYSNIEVNYSSELSDKSFFSLKSGVSAVSDYYGRDGFNDLYARASYTYNVSDTVSISPFVGTSILLDNDDNGHSTNYGGLWFEINF